MITENILSAVAAQYEINRMELGEKVDGRNRSEVFKAKQVAAFLLSNISGYNYVQIANILGYHSKQNIYSAIKKVEEVMQSNNAGDIDAMKEILSKVFAGGLGWITLILHNSKTTK